MKNRGVTLIELMIIVGIITIIAAIAIPSLLRSRINANEQMAVGALKMIHGAQVAFAKANGQYASSLRELAEAKPPVLAGGEQYRGYAFTLAGKADNFTVTADPVAQGRTGNQHYFVDKTGVVRENGIGRADSTSSPVKNTTGK